MILGWHHGSHILGANTTVKIKMHEGTFPTLPELGRALSVFPFDVPVPRMSIPRAPGDDDDDDKPPSFIQDATVCLLFPYNEIFHARYNMLALCAVCASNININTHSSLAPLLLFHGGIHRILSHSRDQHHRHLNGRDSILRKRTIGSHQLSPAVRCPARHLPLAPVTS